MRERLILLLATGLGTGRFPVAPGTAGSILGLGYWWLLSRSPGVWLYLGLCAVGVVFGVWCSGRAAQILQERDPRAVVIDEIVAVPLALFGLVSHSGSLWPVVLAFALFRVFDVWKPTPIRQVERWPGGVGIVADDVLAAIYACAATHGVAWLVALVHR
jgi:phosphatidylglycerophosphatase A